MKNQKHSDLSPIRQKKLSQRGWLVVIGLLLVGGTNEKIYAQKALSFKEAVNLTLTNHPSSTIAQNNAAIAADKIKENRAALLPSVAINSNVDYNVKLQTSVMTFGDQVTRLQMGNKYSSGAYAQADLTVFDMTSRMTIQSSKVDKEVADLKVLQQNETLIYNTGTAYYEVLSLGEKGKLLRDNEIQNKKLFDILKLRYEQGVAKKSEYDRAKVNLNNIQSELTMNQNSYELALNKLKNAMGIDLATNIVVDDSINYAMPAEFTQSSEMNSSDLVSYRIDEKNLMLKQLDIRKKQAAYLPTVSVYGKYGATAFGAEFSTAFNKWFDYSAVGIKLSIPVFSGFKKSSQLSQSRISEQNQRLTEKLNVNTYKLDYQNASTQYLNSYNSLKNNKANLDLAKDVVDATTVEFREGTTDLSNFMDADASYRQAQTNYSTSLLDFLTAQLSYEKAKGTLNQYISNL